MTFKQITFILTKL